EFLNRGRGIQVVQGLVAFAPELHNLRRQCGACGDGVPAIGGDRADSGRRGLELSEACGGQKKGGPREEGDGSNDMRQTTEHNTSVEGSVMVGRDKCRT